MALPARILKFIAILVFPFLATGCLPKTEIDVTKTPGFQITSDRVLVLEQATNLIGDGDLIESFNVKMAAYFSGCGINAGLIRLAAPTTREQFHQAVIHTVQQYHLTSVMEVQPMDMKYLERFGTVVGVTRYHYVVAIKDLSGNPLWRADIDLLPENIKKGDDSGMHKPGLVGEALADAIFTHMKDDNLMPKCPANTPP